MQVHVTNSSNLPAEALEIEYPLLVDEYALVPDSGGAGRWRGGLGISAADQPPASTDRCSRRAARATDGRAGLEGGLPGGRALRHIAPGTPQEAVADGHHRAANDR